MEASKDDTIAQLTLLNKMAGAQVKVMQDTITKQGDEIAKLRAQLSKESSEGPVESDK